jgi:hypothetical protein
LGTNGGESLLVARFQLLATYYSQKDDKQNKILKSFILPRRRAINDRFEEHKIINSQSSLSKAKSASQTT